MPRININEKDRTSPGTPGGYSNNTVLIAGFSTYTAEEIKANAKAVQADDNGVFEFYSADDFEKTIGLVAPEVVMTAAETATSKLPVHYGNQMAYELLNMGYPIIYLNLGAPGKTEITEMVSGVPTTHKATAVELMNKLADPSTWEIFKDKASYDFRFVSHGLLTSEEYAKSDELVKLEKLFAKMREFLPVFDNSAFYDEDGKAVTEQPADASNEDIATVTELYNIAEAKEEAYFTNTKKAERDAIGYTEKFIKNAASWYVAEAHIENKKQAIETAKTTDSNENFGDTQFNAANVAIANLAAYVAQPAPMEDEMAANSGRGDCIALIEVDESKYISGTDRPENRIVTAVNAMSGITADNGKYCACTAPSVVYNIATDERFGGNKKFPGAFHYLACFNNSLGLGFAEWYAAAGYTRGVSSYAIDHTTVKLGEIAVQALEPRNIKNQDAQPKFAVNVIANFRGNYYLWGNRTCQPLGEAAGGNDLVASHFLNIRQLCTTIKKQLYVSCRRFTFDPNSDTLWINFYNSITPMLDRMRADQGIRSYKIERVYTDKKATVKAKIRIVPIEAVEDFILEVSLEDSLGDAAVTITE